MTERLHSAVGYFIGIKSCYYVSGFIHDSFKTAIVAFTKAGFVLVIDAFLLFFTSLKCSCCSGAKMISWFAPSFADGPQIRLHVQISLRHHIFMREYCFISHGIQNSFCNNNCPPHLCWCCRPPHLKIYLFLSNKG